MRNGDKSEEAVPEMTVACKVVLIAGFLGSGKTTLLKKFIDWEVGRGMRPQVIMSEFGDIDIDGLLISDRKIGLITITGGCACCDLREEMVNALSGVVKVSPGSIVFIESTGVGDPAGIMESIAPLIESGAVVISNVIVVYDAGRKFLSGNDSELVKRQLKTADTIVVNKADLISRADIQAAVESIREINPFAELIVTSKCEIDTERALTCQSSITVVKGTESTSKTFRSFGFQIEEPLYQKALEKWLNTLPPSVVRAKGFVELVGQKGLFEVQAARGQVSITPFMTGVKTQAMLVLVTHPMRTDGLVRDLQRCVANLRKERN